MNPTTDQLPPPPQQALPLQPPRSSFSCDRHPDENFSGFCPSCLCERLTTLDQSANATAAASSSRRNSTSSATAAALKSIFRVPSSSITTFEAYKNKTAATATASGSTRTSFFPELRRTKSFSASKNEGLGFSAGVFEPQRKSCDVRGRNTLWTLFSIDDENKPRHSSAQQQALGNTGTLLETNKEDDEEEEEDQFHNEEIELAEEQDVSNFNDPENDIVEEVAEIQEEEEEEEENASVDDLKTMKDHIDLDSQSKKPSLSNFWSAASVLSKKWQKWRRKQKKSSIDGNGVLSSSTLPVKKPMSRKYRETQSEIADYGFGRRSCDVDPRFSLDAGRISFDDPRYSFDEPRASWDGYLIGRTFPRLPPMVEDAPVVQIPRSDMQISVEEPPTNVDLLVPGGSIQTREYYSDSSSKRRKSLDRSSSIRKMAAAVVAEMDEPKTTTVPVSNAKVSPATIDYNHGHGALKRFPSIGGERELARDSYSNSLRDDCSETFELGFRDNGEKKEGKKPRRWRWKLWGFIHRRGGSNKDDDDDTFSRVNGVERSYSESWQDRTESKGGFNKKVLRSNSSVSWRNSSFNTTKKPNSETNGKNRKVGGDEFVLERNRSARYSPNHTDSGLLRFYLTPLRGSRRNGIGIGTGKSKPTSNSNSIARNMLRLY